MLDAVKVKSIKYAASVLVRHKMGGSNNSQGITNAVDVLIPLVLPMSLCATTTLCRLNSEKIRSLLLILDNASFNWRALAIRYGATLYGLHGINGHIQSWSSFTSTHAYM